MDKTKAPFADNPSQGLIPLSITPLCANRMNGWATIVSHLIKYLSIVVEQEKRLSESLNKTSNDLSAALGSDTLLLFSKEESVRSLLSDMTEQQAKRAAIRAGSANNIEEQLVPILKELLCQIKKKINEPDQKWIQLDKDLNNDLELFIKYTTQIRQSLARQQWKGEPIDSVDIPREVPRDPWIANLALQKHIHHCHSKQGSYRLQIKAQEDDYAAFEAVVVQNIKISLATFYDWRSGNFSTQVDQIQFMKEQLGKMDPEQDWSIFKSNNQHRFLQDCLLVDIKSIEYDGFDDPSVKVIKIGKLQRKEGVFKRAYKPCEVALTSSNYFHAMPELQPGEKFYQQPELSIDLLDFTLTPLMMNEKDPEEISFVAKGGGMFGRDVKYKFRGATMTESADWWGAINEQMRNFKGNRTIPSPTKITFADGAGIGEPISNDSTIIRKSMEPPVPTTKKPDPPKTIKPLISEKMKPPTMPPRQHPQDTPPSLSPIRPPTTPQVPQYYNDTPNVFSSSPPSKPVVAPSFIDPHQVSPEIDGMAHLSVAERMEMAFNSKTVEPNDFSNTIPTIPNFEPCNIQPANPVTASNPWDTFEAEQTRW